MKLFNKWETDKIIVKEKALIPYINLQPILVPKTGGRAAEGQRIWTQKTHIVERLINKLMVPGHKGKKHKITSYHITGKGIKTYKIVQDCFKIIEKETKQNPIQVFVTALENAAPREEVTSIEYGGARYSKAVEVSPLRRVDFTLRLMVQGAYSKAFNAKVSIAKSLANEILNAYKIDQTSAAIQKKLELERQADSSR
ncbi:30S ribosomal protein S7 [archaeon]|nr:30S ribosomal protein S7 [archaeon]